MITARFSATVSKSSASLARRTASSIAPARRAASAASASSPARTEAAELASLRIQRAEFYGPLVQSPRVRICVHARREPCCV